MYSIYWSNPAGGSREAVLIKPWSFCVDFPFPKFVDNVNCLVWNHHRCECMNSYMTRRFWLQEQSLRWPLLLSQQSAAPSLPPLTPHLFAIVCDGGQDGAEGLEAHGDVQKMCGEEEVVVVAQDGHGGVPHQVEKRLAQNHRRTVSVCDQSPTSPHNRTPPLPLRNFSPHSVSNKWNRTETLIFPTHVVCKHDSHFPDVVLGIDRTQPGDRETRWYERFRFSHWPWLSFWAPSVRSPTTTPARPLWRRPPLWGWSPERSYPGPAALLSSPLHTGLRTF